MDRNKNKKIVLATAPEEFIFMDIWYSPPLGLAYIASCLEKDGYDVEIVDSHLNKYNVDKAARVIVNKKPDAIGLTATTNNRFKAIELSKKIKELNPNIFIFAGGPHFSTTAEDAIYNISSIDVVVIGEGEYTCVELLNNYFSEKPLRDVRGIVFRESVDNNKIIKTEKRHIINDLDLLPIPSYHLLELKRYSPLPYYFTNLTEKEKRLPAAGIISSRGCPNSCVFCANNSEALKTSFRRRSPKRFVDEVQSIREKYNIVIFNFWDDTFTLSKQHVLDICNEIIQRNLKIKWFARARFNAVDREILLNMKNAGCIAIQYGAESGSEKILKIINKNITVGQIRRVVKDSVRLGIDSLVAFMVSFPGETRDDVEMTFDLIKELLSYSEKVFETDLSPTTIYPGTIIEKIALREGKVIPKDFSWNKKYEFKKNKQLLIVPTIPIYTQQFTLEEIMAFRLKNKFRQRLKQSNLKIFLKGIKFITSIRDFSDLKTLFLIISISLKSINKKVKEVAL